MENNQRHIDDILREALGQYSETPPPAVWEDIARRLPEPPRRRVAFPWWGWLIALLLVSGAGTFAVHTLFNKKTTVTAPSAANTGNTSESNKIITNHQTATAPAGTHKIHTEQRSEDNDSKSTTADNASTPMSHTEAGQNSTVNNGHTQAATRRRLHHGNTHPAAAIALHTHTRHKTGAAAPPVSGKETTGNEAATRTGSQSIAQNGVATPASHSAGGRIHTKRHHVAALTRDQHTGTNDTAAAAPVITTATPSVAAAHPSASAARRGNRRHQKMPLSVASSAASSQDAATNAAAATPAAIQSAVSAHSTARSDRVRNRHHQEKAVASSAAPSQDTATDRPHPANIAAAATRHKSRTGKTAALPVPQDSLSSGQPIALDARNAADGHAKKNASGSETAAVRRHRKPAPVMSPSMATAPIPESVAVNKTKAARTKPAARRPKPGADISSAPNSTASNTKARKGAKQPSKAAVQKAPAPVEVAKQANIQAEPVPAPVNIAPKPAAEVPNASVTARPKLTSQEANLLQPPPEDDGPGVSGGGGMDDASYRKQPRSSNRAWAAGVKAGYEKGFAANNIDKFMAGAFLRFDFGKNVMVTFSPAYKYGSVSSNTLLPPTSFFQVTNSKVDSVVVRDTTGNKYSYRYRQNYDSIIVSYKSGGKVWEVELPLTVGIRIATNLALYAGPVFSFGNQQLITGTNNTIHLSRQDSIINTRVPVQASYFTSYFSHPGQDSFSNFNAAPYQNASTNPVRLGYLAGLQFMLNRLMIDLSVQQSLSGYGNIPGAAIQQSYKQPYVRIGIGYSIFKSKPKVPGTQ